MRLTRACLLCAMALAVPQTVRGQSAPTPGQWQLSGGYSWMLESDVTEKETFPAGWAIAAAAHLNRWLSVAADVDGQYDTIPSFGSDFHLASHAFAGGLRASTRLGRVVEFGQFLAGVVRSSGTVFGVTDVTTQRVVQPGIGFEFPFAASWAISGELDVRFMSTGQEIRVVTGIVRAFR
jgi:hypothetical protein